MRAANQMAELDPISRERLRGVALGAGRTTAVFVAAVLARLGRAGQGRGRPGRADPHPGNPDRHAPRPRPRDRRSRRAVITTRPSQEIAPHDHTWVGGGPIRRPSLSTSARLGVDLGPATLYVATTGSSGPQGPDPAATHAPKPPGHRGLPVVGPRRFRSGHRDPNRTCPLTSGLIHRATAGARSGIISVVGDADFHVLRSAGGRIYGSTAAQAHSWPPPTPGPRATAQPADGDVRSRQRRDRDQCIIRLHRTRMFISPKQRRRLAPGRHGQPAAPGRPGGSSAPPLASSIALSRGRRGAERRQRRAQATEAPRDRTRHAMSGAAPMAA